MELTLPVKSHHRWLLTGRVRFWFAKMRGRGSMLGEGDVPKLGEGERE